MRYILDIDYNISGIYAARVVDNGNRTCSTCRTKRDSNDNTSKTKYRRIMTLTKEDVEMINGFQDILNRGKFASGKQVTEVYNRVFGTKLAPTNCSSCIRHRIGNLYSEVKKIKDKTSEEDNDNGNNKNAATG